MKRLIGFLIVLVLVVAPAAAQAASFQQSEGSFSLQAPLGDDLYVAASDAIINQQVDGDVFVGANTVEVSTTVTEDVYAAGTSVTISGDVRDDVHAAGQMVELNGRGTGDFFAAGNTIKLMADSFVGGDVYVAGADITIGGTVGGTVRAVGDAVTVAAGAEVKGDLIVYSEKEPVIEEGAIVRGNVRREVGLYERRERDERRFAIMNWVRSVLALFLLGAVLLYGAGRLTRESLETLRARAGASILTGGLWLVLFLPLSLILLVTLVGAPLAAMVMALSVLLYVLAAGLAAVAVGRWVMEKLSKSEAGGQLTWSHALIGAVIYESIQLIGGLGWLLTFILVLFVYGAAVLTLMKQFRGDEN